MKKSIKNLFLTLSILYAFSGLGACSNSVQTDNSEETGSSFVESTSDMGENSTSSDSTSKEYSIKLTDFFEGEEVSLLSEGYSRYLSLTDEKEVAGYLFVNSGTSFDYCNGIKLKWEKVNGTNATKYTLHLATNSDFSNEKTIDTGYAAAIKLENLIPGQTYYWKISDSKGVESDIGVFKTKDEVVRAVSVSGVSNMRDLGGWTTETGNKVKYGMVYRSGALDGITEKGKETFFNTLNIKSEIDVRHESTQSVLGKDVNFVHAGIVTMCYIYPEFSQTSPKREFDEKSPIGLKNAFEALANIDNYPFVVHCSAGADRTGTFSFLLNGLLGVSYENLAKDFELTSFSRYGKRWRSAIFMEDDYTFSFDESGVMQDDSGNYVAFGKLYNMMMEHYGTEDGTLASACENYLISVCNVSKDSIDKIRDILVEQ